MYLMLFLGSLYLLYLVIKDGIRTDKKNRARVVGTPEWVAASLAPGAGIDRSEYPTYRLPDFPNHSD